MIRTIVFIICIFVSSNAIDNLTAQKQNALYVQNLIEIEENISKMFEKYILTEFKIPTLNNLINDSYLGSNFSTSNIMGSNIAFESTTNLKIKYAVTNAAYRKKSDDSSTTENYVVQLYNRDLYRNLTSAYDDSSNTSNSYIQIKLQSYEANTIFGLLKASFTVEKECNATLASKYCNNTNNTKTIRWYNSSKKWIEYDKAKFNKGNITTSMTLSEILAESKISDLSVGSYIFISSERYVKLQNDSSGNLQILKVD
jgi:hypothetical protein